MVFSGLLGMLSFVNFARSPSKLQLIFAESCLSLYFSVETTYYSYLYASIKDKTHYQLATGCAKAAMLTGTCVSGLLGQLVVYFGHGSYTALPYISLAGLTIAFAWACFMPPVKFNNYFHVPVPEVPVSSKTALYDSAVPGYAGSATTDRLPRKPKQTSRLASALACKYESLKLSYSDPVVLKWSFWYILSLGTYIELLLNVNILLTYNADETNDRSMLLNGMVVSIMTLCGALSTYRIGKVDVDWDRCGDKFLGYGSLVLSMLTGLCCFTRNDYFVYVMLIGYGTLVQSMFVISISETAKRLQQNLYALVIGFNVFVAVSLATCFSVVVIEMNVFYTTVPQQFLFYGGLYLFMGIIFISSSIVKSNNSRVLL
ncbi:thiamine transporter 2-like isoform X2 [Adelges cooleyi]|nr:thiamine transporter 2-like isoform X2 [Adelges cooleyi]XP_050423500.1 thiamine transporter 2-like isoform X2 [Adelges cooleyi]